MINSSIRKIGINVPPYTGMREALQWLLLARIAVLFLSFGAIVISDILKGGNGVGNFAYVFGLTLITSSFAFTFLQSLLVEKVYIGWGVVLLNIAFDGFLTSAWIFRSSPQDSIFALFYLIQILIVSLTFYRRGALFATLFAIGGFGIVTIMRGGWETGAMLNWGMYTAIFSTLGVVGGFLAEELRRTAQILEEKKAEIKKLTALHERIIADIPTGLLTVDHELKVNFLNPAAEHILDVLSRNCVGRPLNEVSAALMPFFSQIESENIPIEEGEDVAVGENARETSLSATGSEFHRSLFLRAKSEGGGQARLQQTVELGAGSKLRILRGDVAELDIQSGVGRLLDENAKGGRVLLFQDVTKLLNLEDKLKQHEKLAAVGQLAAGIAHEIRNPLASMSASIEMLNGATEWTDPENKKLMEITLKEIDRLNGLISEFLDFVKPEKLKMATVELAEILKEVIAAAKEMKEFKEKVELKERCAAVKVLGNKEKLKQVIWNLLLNAAQAMKRSGVIEVGCEAVNTQRVKFWVEDTGSGMTPEVMTHLYEPFFTTKEKGTGLGLPTAYKIIEAHHGEIKVKSEIEKGTRFEILLPRG